MEAADKERGGGGNDGGGCSVGCWMGDVEFVEELMSRLIRK